MQAAAEFLQRWQYAGLFLVIFAEEAGVPLPLPGDLFIAAMGFLAHSQRAAFAPTALVVATATVLGATLLYGLARTAGRPLLLRVARRFGFTARHEARLEGWLAQRGAVAVVVGRLVPGLRIVMTVVAGTLRLPHRTFVAGTAVAGLVWATLYFWMGYALGAGVERLGAETLARSWPVVVAALAAAGAAAFLRWRRARRRAADLDLS